MLPSLLPFIPKTCSENYCKCLMTIFTSLMWFFSPEDKEVNKQTKFELNNIDFIVVGAGAAGSVVANRLTEIDHWNVLLLEAGGEEPIGADIPGFVFQLAGTAIDWNYTTQAERGSCLLKKGCNWTLGKVMGGSSSMGPMMYVRGNAKDYDDWKNSGNTGWGYKEILPYFKKSEDFKDPEADKQTLEYHGTGGLLTVSKYPFLSSSGKIIEAAFNELGYATKDINAQSQLGITNSQVTLEDGVRKSANAAFVRPIRAKRPNLIVKNNIYVTKILIDPVTKKATGVECKSKRTDKPIVFVAKKEVILSTGTINTPRLLMVSGVGPAEELKKYGISVIQESSVGQNLHDHLATPGLFGIMKNVIVDDDNIDECKEKVGNFEYYARTQKGAFSAVGPAFLAAYVRTEYEKNKNVPDIQFYLTLDERTFSILTVLLTPKSRGVIKLNPKDPTWDTPLIYPGYLTSEPDLKRIIQGMRIGLKLFKTTTFEKNNYKLNETAMPPCDKIQFNSDEYWTCMVRQLGSTFYHPVGTCKMGSKGDPKAVVDPRLRVYGIKGLRIIDASVMSAAPRGNTYAPTLMVAEKACDMIKEDWSEKTKTVKS